MRTQTVLLWICLSLMVGLSACDWISSSPVARRSEATGEDEIQSQAESPTIRLRQIHSSTVCVLIAFLIIRS